MVFKFPAELKIFLDYLCFLQSFSLFDCFLELYFKQAMISFILSSFLLISWNFICNFINFLSDCLLLAFCFTSKLLLLIQSFRIFDQGYCTIFLRQFVFPCGFDRLCINSKLISHVLLQLQTFNFIYFIEILLCWFFIFQIFFIVFSIRNAFII